MFSFYTCPLWIFFCALMLLEYFRVQLGSLKPKPFGHWSHYVLVILGAEATFLPIPPLYYWAAGKSMGDICPEVHDCLVSVLTLYMSSLTAAMIPLLTMAGYLLWKHYTHATRDVHQTKPGASSVGEEETSEGNAQTKSLLQVQAVVGVVTKAARWRTRATMNYKANVVGFGYWIVGISLFVANWMLLVMFTVTYIRHANCNLAIFAAVLVFNTLTGCMHTLVARVMQKAEQARIGSANAGFDRFHLVGLTRAAFHLYSAIFRLTLLVRLENWSNFAVFYVTTSIPTLLHTVVPVNGKWHGFATSLDRAETRARQREAREKRERRLKPQVSGRKLTRSNANAEEAGRPDKEGQRNEHRTCVGHLQAAARHTVKTDLLHQRGVACFNVYLQNSASHMATAWYCAFMLCLELMPNRELFPHYSTQSADVRQQIAFALCAWCADYFTYTMLNVMLDRRYNLSPTYVGLCYLREYPRFRTSVVLIAAHIISDVYLSLTFATMGGVDLNDTVDQSGLC